ncbi:MAG: dipeptidase [Thermoleophilaceae bacterium]
MREETDPARRQTSWDQLEASPVGLVVASTWPRSDDDLRHAAANRLMEEQMALYAAHCSETTGWRLVRGSRDLSAVRSGSVRGVVVHVEGLYRFEDGGFEMLERWHEMGWRSLGLVWNGANSLGGGCAREEPGLSRTGGDVLRWAQEHGVLVDLAHMNESTFWGTLAATDGPVVASHANARALCRHPRNLTDGQLRAIGERGGVVGVVALPRFVRRFRSSVKRLAQHAEHIASVAGPDAVAIGTDFGGLGRSTISGFASVDKAGALIDELRTRGWDSDALEKISWRNAFRVLDAVLNPG